MMKFSDYSGPDTHKDSDQKTSQRLYFYPGASIDTPIGVLENATNSFIAVRAHNMTISSLVADGLTLVKKTPLSDRIFNIQELLYEQRQLRIYDADDPERTAELRAELQELVTKNDQI